MQSCCYILWSEKLGRFYTGATSTTLEDRLQKHIEGYFGPRKYSRKAVDWKVFLVLEAENFQHALRMERKIKSQKSAKYIRNLKVYEELRKKLIVSCIL